MGLAGGAIPSIPGGTILAFVVFFLLGYFLYAGLYAALAAPFNTEAEAQQLVMIPGMMLILAALTWFFAFNSPDGTLARALSLFPFTAPLLMFMRISVQPPPFNASTVQSRMRLPRISAKHLGAFSVVGISRLPRPAPMMMARIRTSWPPARAR